MVRTCNDYLYFAYAKGKLQWLHFYYKSLLLINIRFLSDYCYWYYLNPLFQNHESNKSLSQIILSLFRVSLCKAQYPVSSWHNAHGGTNLHVLMGLVDSKSRVLRITINNHLVHHFVVHINQRVHHQQFRNKVIIDASRLKLTMLERHSCLCVLEIICYQSKDAFPPKKEVLLLTKIKSLELSHVS